MYRKLTNDVWFGDWQSPFETGKDVKAIVNLCHDFQECRGTSGYWGRLAELDWQKLYLRVARPDRSEFDPAIIASLTAFARVCKEVNLFPLLSHCQMGGHRGPTGAIFIAWELADRSADALEQLNADALRLKPSLIRATRRRGRLYPAVLKYCRENSR